MKSTTVTLNNLDAVKNGRPHQVVWDGTNANGDQVSSGVYFYRLAIGNETLTKKMTLLK